MSGVHARRAPSDADRWAVCAGALRETEGLPDVPNVFSAEGTVLHELSHLCLDLGMEPWDFIGQIWSADGFSFEITEERAKWVHWALEVVRDLPGMRFLETRVDLGDWLPGDFGTLDVAFATDELISVIDFKFGMVRVKPTTRQIKLYALGIWRMIRHLTKARRFRLLIIQPRVSGGGGEVFLDLDELLAFGEEIRAAGERTLDPNAPLTAGSGCYGCQKNQERGGPGCDTLTMFMLSVLQQTADDVADCDALGVPPTLPSAGQMAAEAKSFMLRHEKMFTRWMKAVREQELAAAEYGAPPLPGMKLVDGDQGDRVWENELEAEAQLIDIFYARAFNKKLKSPAQVEKELRPTRTKPGNPAAWDSLQALITRGESKPLLVDADDARPERKPSAQQQFGEVEAPDSEIIG